MTDNYETKIFHAQYQNRFNIVKHARELLKKGEAHGAIKFYKEYLDLISTFYATDLINLDPTKIEGNGSTTEKLLLSQVCFDLARLCDLMKDPNAVNDVSRYLEIFVKFTVGQPFQAVNAQMLRRQLVKSKFRHKEVFRSYLDKIYSDSKICFVASFSLGSNHPVTEDLRDFKKSLLKYRYGKDFIHYYYLYSPHLITLVEKTPLSSSINRIIIRPTLTLIAFFYRKIK